MRKAFPAAALLVAISAAARAGSLDNAQLIAAAVVLDGKIVWRPAAVETIAKRTDDVHVTATRIDISPTDGISGRMEFEYVLSNGGRAKSPKPIDFRVTLQELAARNFKVASRKDENGDTEYYLQAVKKNPSYSDEVAKRVLEIEAEKEFAGIYETVKQDYRLQEHSQKALGIISNP